MNRDTLHLLAGLAHDLRTPLSAIAGHTSLLSIGVHGSLSQAQAESVHRIQENQRQMIALIGAFMKYAEAASGDVMLELQECAVELIVAQAVDAMTAEAQGRGVRVHWTDPSTARGSSDNAPVNALAVLDEAAARTVLDALLQDALVHCAPDTVIHVHLRETEGVLRVSVDSAGASIPEDGAESVFVPYVRDASGRPAYSSGRSLCLPYARALARAMGAEVSAVAGGASRLLQFDVPAAANLRTRAG